MSDKAREKARESREFLLTKLFGGNHALHGGGSTWELAIDSVLVPLFEQLEQAEQTLNANPHHRECLKLLGEARTHAEELARMLSEALSYIRSCEQADVAPRSDGHGYQDAEAALSSFAAWQEGQARAEGGARK